MLFRSHRGGLGSERVLEVRAPEITVSALYDRMVSAPWGLFGGGTAATSSLLVKLAGTEEFKTFREAYGTASNSRIANIKLRRGDRVMLRSPGGGGFGRPVERPSDAVLQDVLDGFISVGAARDHYGVEIENSNGEIVLNEIKTAELRAQSATDGKIR